MKKVILLLTLTVLSLLLLVSCGEPVTYTVNFDTDGGDKIPSATVNEGEAVPEPDEPEKDYASFLGWYLGNAEYDFSSPVTADITLTAKWEREEFRVKFDTAGGSLIDRVKVYGGDPVSRPQ